MAGNSADLPVTRLFLRRDLLRLRGTYCIAAVLVLSCAGAILVSPLLLVITAPGLVLAGVEAWLQVTMFLEITDRQVTLARSSRSRDRVPRSLITSIHIHSGRIWFCGPAGELLMGCAPSWSRSQLIRVADELEVSVYDHRRWWGIGERQKGRLLSRVAWPELTGELDTTPAAPAAAPADRVLLIRRNLLRPVDFFLVLALLAMTTWAAEKFPAVPVPVQLPVVIGIYLVVVGLEAKMQASTFVAATGDQVIIRAFPRSAQFAARPDIRGIEMHARGIRLIGELGTVALTAPAYWSAAQLIRLAGELQVPLQDSAGGGTWPTRSRASCSTTRAAPQAASCREPGPGSAPGPSSRCPVYSRDQASVRTERRICSISSNCS